MIIERMVVVIMVMVPTIYDNYNKEETLMIGLVMVEVRII